MRKGNQAIIDQLNQLPLRALSAFAARCTRRVEQWGGGAALEAIALAEQFARGRSVLAADAARAAARAEAGAAQAHAEADRAADAEANPSFAYRAAATNTAAAYAARTVVTATGAPVAALAAARVAAYVDPRIDDAITADLQRLVGLNLGSFPEPGAPLDPSEEGPLGPLWRQPSTELGRDAVHVLRRSPRAIHP
jgi:hypothetical protein